MSRLRTECRTSNEPALPDDTALFLIRDSVARRRSLIHGRLHDGRGRHCAIREGYHTPTEMERYYIDSFVAAIVTDRDFLRLCIQVRMETEEYQLSRGGCPECGKVNTDGEAHWGRNCDGQRLLDFLPKKRSFHERI